jgi:hypothetical protein
MRCPISCVVLIAATSLDVPDVPVPVPGLLDREREPSRQPVAVVRIHDPLDLGPSMHPQRGSNPCLHLERAIGTIYPDTMAIFALVT